VGGTRTLYSASISISTGVQTYHLQQILSASNIVTTGQRVEMKEIFSQGNFGHLRHLSLMTFQGGDGIEELHQVRVRTFTSDMQKEGAIQLRTIQRETQGPARLLFEQSLFNLSDTIGSWMAANHLRTLRGNLHALGIKTVVFSSFDLDH
jgi:hypothetical protein